MKTTILAVNVLVLVMTGPVLAIPSQITTLSESYSNGRTSAGTTRYGDADNWTEYTFSPTLLRVAWHFSTPQDHLAIHDEGRWGFQPAAPLPVVIDYWGDISIFDATEARPLVLGPSYGGGGSYQVHSGSMTAILDPTHTYFSQMFLSCDMNQWNGGGPGPGDGSVSVGMRITVVPAPAAFILVGLGTGLVGCLRRRRTL